MTLEQKNRDMPLVVFTEGFKYHGRITSKDDLTDILKEALRQKASNIYIQPQKPIIFMLDNVLHALGEQFISFKDMEQLCCWSSGLEGAMSQINSGQSVNGRYEVLIKPENVVEAPLRLGFRVNISGITSGGNKSAQIVIRPISANPPLPHEVGLTKERVIDMCSPNGISIIAGATGDGKTTTFASVIRYIMEGDTAIKGSIVEHAEPIEFTYDNIVSSHSIITQSSIPENFHSFSDANIEAMRRKPALIVIGELRDEQSIQAAVEAAKTGHPVFGTVHAVDPTVVVSRLISRFPLEQHSAAINDICTALRFIMAQKLVPCLSGGLIAARSYIYLEKEHRKRLALLSRLEDVSREMEKLMDEAGHTFAQEATRLFDAGLISDEVALSIGRL